MDSVVQKLARAMALNHVDVSLSGATPEQQKEILRPSKEVPRGKVVVVVGAGASFAACELPLAKKSYEHLREHPSLKWIPEEVLTEEIDRLSSEYQLSPDDFETKLLALSRFNPKGLTEALQWIYDRADHPSFTYELIAHLLKHRFVDAVINFNFDQVLDQAIDDEVGADNYVRIVSDGDSSVLSQYRPGTDALDARPLYIKPHGTASHPSTMRFTRGDYYKLPKSMRARIGGLFSAGPVHLVVIGFAMQSFEFIRILESAKNPEIFAHFLCLEPPRIPWKAKPGAFKTDCFLEAGGKKSLDARMRDLWRAISDQFVERFTPRDVCRHEFLSRILTSKVALNRDAPKPSGASAGYLKGRLYIETALSVAKAKGFIHLRQLSRGRAGRYFERFLGASGGKGSELTLRKVCEKLGLSSHEYSNEAMRLSEGGEGWKRLVLDRVQFMKKVGMLADRALSEIALEDRNLKNDASKCFRDTLLLMYDRDEVEVIPRRASIQHELFRDPTVIETTTAMRFHTLEILSKEWDTLLSIAESGEWLLSKNVIDVVASRGGRRIFCVAADDVQEKKLRAAYKKRKVDVQVKLLPWWLHNQHMTAIVKGGAITDAIYFERRLRSSGISPLRLEHEDARLLAQVFGSYMVKAASFRDSMLVDNEKIEEILEPIFSWARAASAGG